MHAFGQTWLHVLDFRLNRIDDFERIGTIPNNDDATDGIRPAFVQNPAPKFWSELNRCDVANVHRSPIHRGQDDVLNILRGLDQTESADHILHVVGFDDFRSDVVVAALYRFKHHTHWNVEGAQLHRVHVDLILANESANAGNFRHTRNRVELISNEPILKGAKGARIVWAIDRVPEHLAHARRVRSECWDNSGGKKA